MCFDPVETGERIRKLREHLGYSQTQLSEKINFSRSYISKVELGIRIPSIDFLMEVSDFAGITLDYLIVGKRNEKQINQVKKEINSLIDALYCLERKL